MFTETGLEPVGYRRVLLAIGYLLYVLRSPCVYVRLALREIVDLDQRRYTTWIGRLRAVVQALPGRVEFPPPQDLLVEARVERLMDDVTKCMDKALQEEIDATDRLELVHGRTEDDPDGGPPRRVVRKLRHYLRVYNPGHRKALARVLLSSHNLATCRRRYTHNSAWGLRCRFCGEQEETVSHVWLVCGGNEELVAARKSYVLDILRAATVEEATRIRSLGPTPTLQLKALLDVRSFTSSTAEFAYVVQELAEAVGLAPLGADQVGEQVEGGGVV